MEVKVLIIWLTECELERHNNTCRSSIYRNYDLCVYMNDLDLARSSLDLGARLIGCTRPTLRKNLRMTCSKSMRDMFLQVFQFF